MTTAAVAPVANVVTQLAARAALPTRRTPVRTCVACRTSGGKRGLLRVVRLPDGQGVALDSTGKRSGRGAYVCPTETCVTLALKRKQLERSLKTPIEGEVVEALHAAVIATAPESREDVADESPANRGAAMPSR